MNTVPLAMSLLTLNAAALGQTYQIVPNEFTSSEGTYFSDLFGTYPTMRLQWADGELPGGTQAIRGFGMREDASYFAVHHGRKHHLEIRCSDGDSATMGNAFASNILSTPTMVFSGNIALPSTPGRTVGPAPWLNRYQFDFSSIYLHSGTKDLLLDMTFTNGALDNSVFWKHQEFRSYAFDGYNTNPGSAPGTVVHLPGRTNIAPRAGCTDSASTSTHGAFSYLELFAYGPVYPTVSWRNKMRASIFGAYVPPSTLIASVVGFKSDTTGTIFPGVSCRRLHVDLSVPYAVVFVQSDPRSERFQNFFGGNATTLVPYDATFGGTKITVQSAWADTGKGSMKLTSAGETTYPAMARRYRRNTTFATWSGATTGQTSTWSSYFPVLRYKK